ncbi:glycosyltransferase [Kocuria indica]|uniref:Glycosyltransferase n=1 Tax=Kocuria marina subsp. indica TaxID=1049583 RepID=A0A6N9R1N0_9MICC|nr:glycosyltransferase [Kocuria indica]NDO78827.1 glycosyltransferase [Kocuria indica]
MSNGTEEDFRPLVDLNEAIMSSNVLSPDSWVRVDREGYRRFVELDRAARRSVTDELSSCAGVVTDDAKKLRFMAGFASHRAVRFHYAPSVATEDLKLLLAPFIDRKNRAPSIVYLRHELEEVSGLGHDVHQFFDQLPQGTAALNHHALLIPSTQRDDQGLPMPRSIASRLVNAADASGAVHILTDDLHVTWSLLGHKNLSPRVIFVMSSPRGDESDAIGAKDVARLADVLLSRDGRILVTDTTARDVVALQLGVERARVLLSVPEWGIAAIQDLADQGRPMVTLARNTNLLIAGHDFKFLGELVGVLQRVHGLTLSYDRWRTQRHQDVQASDTALSEADVILCEFSSNNAVWYSWHKRPGQTLIVHFHGYELFQDIVHDINVANVDKFVFVSEFYRQRVIQELGWPAERTTVIPNMIEVAEYLGTKIDDARFHLGLAGYVPILKRPDRALDLLETLLEHDDRYVLHLRGRNPWDYAWMWRQPVVQDAYRAFYERLIDNPELLAHVSFDAFDPDMGRWFRRIGWMLSPSSRETFHLAPVEGQASGAVPVVWDREGAREIFPEEFVHADMTSAADGILRANAIESGFDQASARARQAVQRWDLSHIAPLWADVLFGGSTQRPAVADEFDLTRMQQNFDETGDVAMLDRMLLLLLIRERDLVAAEALLNRYPGREEELSARTRELLSEHREEHLFRSGSFVRPPRSPGAAYLPVRDTALAISLEMAGAGGDLIPAREVNEAAAQLRITTLGSAAPASDIEALVADPELRPVQQVQWIADAVTRAARVHRPAALVTSAHFTTAWGTVLAARRLGVPAILETAGGDPDAAWMPGSDEFDAAVDTAAEVTTDVVTAAVSAHAHRTAATPSVTLGDLTVGVIADEFTQRTIAGRCHVVSIPRRDAYLHVASQNLDVLFVESAWTGHNREWFHGVAYYPNERDDIERAIATARALGVPVIFWNKEDPVHFRSFAPTAALCDAIYTTDADRIPAYLQLPDGHRPATVASMPFYAEPVLHNPLPGSWAEKHTVSYAGTYYGARYAHRSAELDALLAAAATQGLTIYDRQVNVPNSPYHFPSRYDDFIEGGLSYDQVLEAYKAHPVHINVNSVDDSPTMFSRRVVEIAASGAVVVSGTGLGLSRCLPAVPTENDPTRLEEILAPCMKDRAHWRQLSWEQLRQVRRSYLAEHALAIMFRGVGVPVAISDDTAWSAVVEDLTPDVAAELLAQTLRPQDVTVAAAHEDALVTLASAGIPVVSEPTAPWICTWRGPAGETWAEDIMHAARFAPRDVHRLGARVGDSTEHGLMSWSGATSGPEFVRRGGSTGRTLLWLLPAPEETTQEEKNND